MQPAGRDTECWATFLEPAETAEMFLGLAPKPKDYTVDGTVEHLAEAQERVYWAIRLKRGRQEVKGFAEIPQWSQHFGFQSGFVESPDVVLKRTDEAWFRHPDYETAWFEVQSSQDGVGYHFAVALYIGLHLRYVGGPRVRSIHLVADLESKWNIINRIRIRF